MCASIDPPYLLDYEGECLVGISKWESKEAFLGSGFVLRAPEEIVEGETRPRQRFLLEDFSPHPMTCLRSRSDRHEFGRAWRC